MEKSASSSVEGSVWLDLIEGVRRTNSGTAIATPTLPVSYRDFVRRIGEHRKDLGRQGFGAADRVELHLDASADSVAFLIAVMSSVRQVILNPPSRDRGGQPPVAKSFLVKQRTVGAGEPSGLVLFTSGTTGRPKAVVHNHASLMAGVWATIAIQDEGLGNIVTPPSTESELVKVVRQNATSGADLRLTLLSGMPIATIAGLSMALRTLVTGACYATTESSQFDAATILDLLETHKVTNIGVAPFMAQLLVRAQRTRSRILSLFYVGIGAGPSPQGLVQDVEKTLGGIASVGYGTTETGGVALMPRVSDELPIRAGTIGRPVPGCEARIVDEDLNLVPLGGLGELSVTTPGLCLGYEGESALRAYYHGGKRWFLTGDRARWRRDHNVELHGRQSEMILRGGRNIDPVEIEQMLEYHPNVERAVVLGTPSRIAGEEDIEAVVVVVPSGSSSLGEIRRFCVEKLGPIKTPSSIHVVDEIPTTYDGSPDRGASRDLLQRIRSSARKKSNTPGSQGSPGAN